MGLKALLDTNAIIALLKNEGKLTDILRKYSEVYISIISVLEFQSFERIDLADLALFDIFLSRVIVVNLTNDNDRILKEIVALRKAKALKLPDAIVAASAIVLKADLFTADKRFSKIEELNIITW